MNRAGAEGGVRPPGSVSQAPPVEVMARFLRNMQNAFDTRVDYLDNCEFFFGGVPERSKGTDCKSVGYAFEGSNPSPSTRI